MRELIAEARRLDEAATPGPWDAKGVIEHGAFVFDGAIIDSKGMTLYNATGEGVDDDDLFTAAARTLVPALANAAESALGAVERVEATIAGVLAILDAHDRQPVNTPDAIPVSFSAVIRHALTGVQHHG